MRVSNGKNRSRLDVIHTHKEGRPITSLAGRITTVPDSAATSMQTVFHLTTDNHDEQRTTLTIAENLTKDDSVEMDDVAVVAQSHGIEPLTADGEGNETVESMLESGISFKACANTLELKELTEEDLLEGVETVPSGGGELTRLQHEGYAYIRP